MKHLISFFKGVIFLSIEGEQLERFLNLCKTNGILLEHISLNAYNHASVQMQAKDFHRLVPLRRKTKVHIHIQKKHGLPFFFFRNKKRKAFFLGILVFFIMIMFFCSRIWSIEVYGNRQISTKEILAFLESGNVIHGIPKKQIDCGLVAQNIREHYPLTTWVSVKLEGTNLRIYVQENISNDLPENNTAPCNITANKNGIIVDMITRSGIPAVKIGDVCKEGDILISGCIEMLNDNKELIRREYVTADGDVFIKYRLPYYQEIPVSYDNQTYFSHKKYGLFLQIYDWYMDFGAPAKERAHTFTTYQTASLTKNFVIPFSFGIITQKEYKETHSTYTEKEIIDLSWKNLQRYEQNLLEKGVQISANNVKIKVTDQICVSSGYLEVIEKIGIQTPLEVKESLEIERNATNG